MRRNKSNDRKIAGLLSFCVGVGYLLTACSPKQSLPSIAPSTAVFDQFTYTGEDEFYQTNPLPDSNYFYNPILAGWYSDPSICTNGQGDYFLVTSTFTYYPGVPLFHSRDLINWKQVGHVLDRPSQLVNMEGQDVSGGIFAPAISYNPHNQTYYMVTTNVGAGNFFVKTKDPFGSWSDPIMLPEVGGIDPSFFFDEDGRAYIVNNDDAPNNKPEYDGHRTIRVQEFDPETDRTIGPRKILVNKGAHPEDNPIWIEGPHLYKIKGKYYLMSAEGGTGDYHSEVIFRADSPMGPFVPWKGNPILTQRHLSNQRTNPITCAGHADLIQGPAGDWWAVFLACRPINHLFENLGRETFLLPVRWSEDGFPYLTQGDEVIPQLVKCNHAQRNDSTYSSGNFEIVDNFDTDRLDLTWMTLRAPVTGLSLTQYPGYLMLPCGESSAAEKKTPSLVCRRMQHHKFTCTTRMLFHPSNEQEAAGLLLFKNETHYYFMGVNRHDNELYISLWQTGEEGNRLLAEQPLVDQTQAIDLKVVSTGMAYDFYYAETEGQWKSLCKQVDARYLSTAQAGGFTGSTIGLYAVKQK